jgi:hypothetical protein
VKRLPPGAGEDDPAALDIPACAANLSWSVDGRVFFHASLGAVFRTEMATGTRTRVAQGVRSDGFTFAPDGETLFVTMVTPHHYPMLITNFGDRARP